MNGLIQDKNIYLSLVIPLFNEEDNIDMLLNKLAENLQPLNVTYEIILVDDGSIDDTWKKIKFWCTPQESLKNQIKQSSIMDRSIKGIKLARNFGHQHALLAGLSTATGQAVISMDGDLQHPPSLIQKMLDKHREGYLVVNTCRDDIKVASMFKRKTSSLFYKIFSWLTDVPLSSGLSDFRLLDRVVLNQLLQLKDVDLFLRGAVEWLGFTSITIPYEADKRFSGTSKYTISNMVNFAKGSIISFSTKPLIIGIWIGTITSILAFLEIIYIIYQWLSGKTVAGWASTVGITSFLFGILFIILGILGMYLARIHVSLQNRPRFIIADKANNDQ